MNCPTCGEICRCSSQSVALPRWMPDADADSKTIAAVEAVSSTNEDVYATSRTTEIGNLTLRCDSTEKDALSETSAAASDTSSCEGDQHTDEASAWRDELTARLNLYRARRKPRPPRYPSLRLAFDRPVPAINTSENLSSSPVFGGVANSALALDAFNPSNGTVMEPATDSSHPQYPTTGGATSSPTQQPAVPHNSNAAAMKPAKSNVGKILEFPRLFSAGPPVRLDELADPVFDRPRILEVPEVVPPPPALGGITIDAERQHAVEKQPGIDVPLQSGLLLRRAIASLIDGLIIAVACGLAGFIFWKVAGVRPPRLQLLALVAGSLVVFWAVYQQLLIVYAGATPGLRLAKLELACFDGSSAKRKLRRWRVLASYLSAVSLGMGYAWVFLDEDQLCWHDRITRTYLAPKRIPRGPIKSDLRSGAIGHPKF